MVTQVSSEGGAGSEAQSVLIGTPLGRCIWCGHVLEYWRPGDPPFDCVTDEESFYTTRANVSRDLSLIDFPLNYGKFCPFAPPHPLGQYSVHQLVGNVEQP